jgi:hypothetical protein
MVSVVLEDFREKVEAATAAKPAVPPHRDTDGHVLESLVRDPNQAVGGHVRV